ncbi:M55 family metallopeptidase [Dehalococcoidia bacterium]|nr:M55 family metallopeptidase [Dehalococcoidia bacterium]
MEGISGVVASDHTSVSHKEYERFRKLMTADANAAIEGALSGGAVQVVTDRRHRRRASATQCRGTGGAGS